MAMRPEQIPYGVKDFREIHEKGLYYVDKTAYIPQVEKALDQLRRHAADPRIPQLAGGTPVHFIDLEFVGREMRVCEELAF